MPNPAPKTALLTRNSQGYTQIFLLSDDAPASLATTLSGARGLSYDGIAYVLFDPAPLGGQSAPWRKGDILVSRTQTRLRGGRAILRLRPGARGRVTTYAADIIYSASGGGLQGLALDPHGRLYAGSRQAGKLYRYEPDGRGGVREIAWATIPAGMTWNGDIGLSPDGMLFTSTGDGEGAGKLYKFSIGGDPRPFPQIQPIAHRLVFTASGEMGGFSFFDNDTVLFTDGRDAYYSRKIDPTLDATVTPSGQPQLPSLIIPSFAFTEPAIQGLEVIDVAVMRNAWQTYLSQQDVVRQQTTWPTETYESVPYDEWANDPRCADLDRRLHRMYGWIAAREPAPLRYRFQIDPLTNNPRIGPKILEDHDIISRDDALDGYLAHVGHCLWVQIHNGVPWELHDYDIQNIGWLLEGKNLYIPLNEQEPRYRLNAYWVKNASPSDPVESFNFLTGSDPAIRSGASFIRATPTETIVAFTKWIQENVYHFPMDVTPGYGYEGLPPSETVYKLYDVANIGNRNWAWRGCQTAAGFMIHLMRLLLIPSRQLGLVTWGEGESYAGTHCGVYFRAAELACYHVDEFYAVAVLQDKTLDPLEIYNGGPDRTVNDYINDYRINDLTDKDVIQANQEEFFREEGRIAFRNRTHQLQVLFWKAKVKRPQNSIATRDYREMKDLLKAINHLEKDEVDQLLVQYGGLYESFIYHFMSDHRNELPLRETDDVVLQAGLDLYQSLRGDR